MDSMGIFKNGAIGKVQRKSEGDWSLKRPVGKHAPEGREDGWMRKKFGSTMVSLGRRKHLTKASGCKTTVTAPTVAPPLWPRLHLS